MTKAKPEASKPVRAIKMLQGKGALPYRHKINPEVLTTMKTIQNSLVEQLGIFPSQAVLISRSLELYRQYLQGGTTGAARRFNPESETRLLLRAAGRTA